MSPRDCEYHSRERYLLMSTIEKIGEHMCLDMIDPDEWLREGERQRLGNHDTREQGWSESWRTSTGDDIDI